MKIIKSIPYIFLIIGISISTIIAMINNMSFSVFLKRTTIFYIIIFAASKIFIHHIIIANKSTIHTNKIDIVVPSEKYEIKTDNNEDDDFIPLDLEEYKG